ncbi:hypothetical protein Tco_0833216 [Tanacetum coccineum]
MPKNDLPTNFSSWFRDKISTLYTKKSSECSFELFVLASGPKDHATYYNSCVVNGVKFVVHIRDERLLTQYSRVSMPGEDGSINSSDLALTTNLDDLEYTRLSGVGPSMEVSFIPNSLIDDDDDEYNVVHVLSSDSEDSSDDSD